MAAYASSVLRDGKFHNPVLIYDVARVQEMELSLGDSTFTCPVDNDLREHEFANSVLGCAPSHRYFRGPSPIARMSYGDASLLINLRPGSAYATYRESEYVSSFSKVEAQADSVLATATNSCRRPIRSRPITIVMGRLLLGRRQAVLLKPI